MEIKNFRAIHDKEYILELAEFNLQMQQNSD